MFCPKCGNQIQNGATFCPKCGTSLAGHAQQAQQPGVTGQPTGQQPAWQAGQPPIGQQGAAGSQQAPGPAAPPVSQPQPGTYGVPGGYGTAGTAVATKKPLGGKLPILIIAIAAVVVALLIAFLVVKPGGGGGSEQSNINKLLSDTPQKAADVLNNMYEFDLDGVTAYTDSKEYADLANAISSDMSTDEAQRLLDDISDLSKYDGAGILVPMDTSGNEITAAQIASGTSVGSVLYAQLRTNDQEFTSQQTIDAIDAVGTNYDHILAANYSTLSTNYTNAIVSAFYGKDYYGIGGYEIVNMPWLTHNVISQDCGVLVIVYANYGADVNESLIGDSSSDEQFKPNSYDEAKSSWQSLTDSLDFTIGASDLVVK